VRYRLELICIVASALLVTACSKQSPPPAPANTAAAKPAQWDGFVNRFIEDSLKDNPFFAVDMGRHEYDGQAPDWSAQGLADRIEHLKAARAEAEAFPADALRPEQRFERDYLIAGVINRELFWMDTARFPFKNPAWYVDRLDPDPYLSREYAPLEKRMVGFIGYARNIPQLAADIHANLHMPMPKSLLERGIAGFGGYALFY
jgi:hypothetical protein